MRRRAKPLASREILRRLGRWIDTSIGEMESLAGVDVQCHAERQELWEKFRHLYGAPSQQLIDAVMDHCAQLTLARIQRGELCLLPSRY